MSSWSSNLFLRRWLLAVIFGALLVAAAAVRDTSYTHVSSSRTIAEYDSDARVGAPLDRRGTCSSCLKGKSTPSTHHTFSSSASGQTLSPHSTSHSSAQHSSSTSVGSSAPHHGSSSSGFSHDSLFGTHGGSSRKSSPGNGIRSSGGVSKQTIHNIAATLAQHHFGTRAGGAGNGSRPPAHAGKAVSFKDTGAHSPAGAGSKKPSDPSGKGKRIASPPKKTGSSSSTPSPTWQKHLSSFGDQGASTSKRKPK